LTLGFFLFALSEGFGLAQIGAYTPIVAMSLVVILAILGFTKGKTMVSVWLLIGVAFFAV
jgi:hypothetical protein